MWNAGENGVRNRTVYRHTLGTHATDKSITVGGRHDLLLYRSLDDYLEKLAAYVRTGLILHEPILVALPYPRARLLQSIFGSSDAVTFIDMNELGGNPARIIPALRRFVYNEGERPVRFVAEPAWPGRGPAELGEVLLHDSLLDLATAGTQSSILCAYNAAGLDPSLLVEAERLHTHVIEGSGRRASVDYAPQQSDVLFSTPLPGPPAEAYTLRFDHDLASVRRFVEDRVATAGLDRARLQDLLLAVSEVVTNTVVHAGTPGLLHVWPDTQTNEVVCEVSDGGHVGDCLAGRLGPYPVALHGWGLWMVNQICDLVELRSGAWGTTARLHVRVP
jgi:anti-sigma regulatory factor (Ser/Thr protein kinase)